MGASDDDAEAGVVELLDGSFEALFLTLGEIKHVLGVLEEDGALGLGLGDVDRAAEYTDLGLLGLLDRTFGFAAKHHTLNYAGLFQTASHDLHDADIIDVEVERVLGEDGENSLCNKGSEDLLSTGLLTGDYRAEGLGEFVLGAHVL